MKNRILFTVLLLFCGLQKSQAQSSCVNSANIFTQNTQIIPPPGTPGITGPYYGCLTDINRQVWYVIPICRDYTIGGWTKHIYGWGGVTSTGSALYGPFENEVINCAQLDASKLISCQQINNMQLSFQLNFNDTLLSGNYYYLLNTFADTVPTNTTMTLGTTGAVNWIGDCFECNNRVSQLDDNNFCLLTVDTAINKAVLTWEEFAGNNVYGYIIHRETTVTGIFDSVATVPVGSLSTFTDMASFPQQHNYTYSITPVDSCGNSYGVNSSSILSTIHLLSFAGANNQAQLIWNNIYPQGTFVPQYYIYRNSNGGGWQVIDSIGISLPTITYTDIFAPAGTNQYTVELHQTVACNPMRNSSVSYQSVFSNTSTAVVTGYESLTNNPLISIYPNPAQQLFTVDLSYLSHTYSDITIYDISGRIVSPSKRFAAGKSIFSTDDLEKGVYIVEIKAGKIYRTRLVIE